MLSGKWFLLAVMLVSPGVIMAAPGDALMRAGKSVEQRHYDEAWKDLYRNVSSIDAAARDGAYFTLASVFQSDYFFYDRLHESAVRAQEDYLNMLLKDKSAKRSKYAPLYYALLMLEKGNARAALSAVDRYEKEISNAKGVKLGKAYAEVVRTLARHAGNQKESAKELAAIKAEDTESILLLAGALAGAGQPSKAIDLVKKAGMTVDKIAREASTQGVASYLAVMDAQNNVEDALNLLLQADLSRPALKDESPEGRVIYFYSAALLREIADTYANASQYYLNKLTPGGRYEFVSGYLAGERSFYANKFAQASKALGEVIGKGKLPPRLEERGGILLNMAKAAVAKKADINGATMELLQKNPDKTDALADIAWACTAMHAKCMKFSASVEKMLEGADPRRAKNLFVEAGKYQEAQANHGKSLALLELVRDKANKNKIEYNDPVMLTYLAEGYRATKSFSEHLEIYFEMAKQYPAVRQIQDTVQGMYSVEQKSAGDVKIF